MTVEKNRFLPKANQIKRKKRKEAVVSSKQNPAIDPKRGKTWNNFQARENK